MVSSATDHDEEQEDLKAVTLIKLQGYKISLLKSVTCSDDTEIQDIGCSKSRLQCLGKYLSVYLLRLEWEGGGQGVRNNVHSCVLAL